MHTPWGVSQTTKVLAPGIIDVSTAGHGGIHLDEERNALVPPYMRSVDGWYEEDVDWTIVAAVFPQAFSPKLQASAEEIMRNWLPEIYETFYKRKLSPGESFKRDEANFLAKHKNDYIVMAAFGPGQPGIKFEIPKGQVLVAAGRGGRRGPEAHYAYPEDTAYFLVPKAEYGDKGGPFGFVIDESRHRKVDFEG